MAAFVHCHQNRFIFSNKNNSWVGMVPKRARINILNAHSVHPTLIVMVPKKRS